ncbi:MAG: PQQ-dependent sugar dehydrogenase [Bacteroidetes bacterium]|nr:PQQ-dependent sugar dehydrogenase [Bacteroidota bacterium]
MNATRIKLVFAFILTTFGCNINAQISNYLLDSTNVNITTIVDSNKCDMPWDINWGPDNRLWFTNRKYIVAYNFSTQQLDTIFNKGKGNYMGLAFHPNFSVTPEVFATWDTSLYYGGGQEIQVFKYIYDVTGDSLKNETLFVKWFHPGEHSGGRLLVSQDSKLLVTTSEYGCQQDTGNNYLSGKVLRINLDGSIPSDNPIPNNLTYSFGHRNSQGIIQLPNGKIYASEMGQMIDELNFIKPNKYYGWMDSDGNNIWNTSTCKGLPIEFPIDAGTNPPSGIDWYSHSAIPEFKDCILESVLSFGGYIGGVIAYRLNSSGDSVVSKKHYFIGSGMKRIRDVAVAPDGSVYIISNDRAYGRIRKIEKSTFNSVEKNDYIRPSISIYPNPATENVFIKSNSGDSFLVEMIDVFGNIVCKTIINAQNNVIGLQNIAAGVYFTKIYFNKTVISDSKIVVIK